jgi:hypothetical protein
MNAPKYFSVTNIEGNLVTTEIDVNKFNGEEDLIAQFNNEFGENGKVKKIVDLMGTMFNKKIDRAILVKQVA